MSAIGFRVKSGHAIAIILSGSAAAPIAISRHVVDLSDPSVEETKQPYHSGMGEAEEDERAIARRVKIIERVTSRSVAALVEAARSPTKLRASLVVGSVIDPATVGNQHIRAHANEGRLFRTVLENALAAHGIPSKIFVEKQMAEAARDRLKRSDAEIARMLGAFGKTLGSPWRANEKAAATAAWMSLR